MGTTLYTNVFGQQVVIGDLDLEVMKSGSIVGIVSPNQASPAATISAGAFVKIDTTITSGYVINFLQAGQNDLAFGVVRRLVKQGVFSTPQAIEVCIPTLTVMWLLTTGTVTPGATVYSDSTGALVSTSSAGAKTRGIALDYGLTGTAIRVLITPPLAIVTA